MTLPTPLPPAVVADVMERGLADGFLWGAVLRLTDATGETVRVAALDVVEPVIVSAETLTFTVEVTPTVWRPTDERAVAWSVTTLKGPHVLTGPLATDPGPGRPLILVFTLSERTLRP